MGCPGRPRVRRARRSSVATSQLELSIHRPRSSGRPRPRLPLPRLDPEYRSPLLSRPQPSAVVALEGNVRTSPSSARHGSVLVQLAVRARERPIHPSISSLLFLLPIPTTIKQLRPVTAPAATAALPAAAAPPAAAGRILWISVGLRILWHARRTSPPARSDARDGPGHDQGQVQGCRRSEYTRPVIPSAQRVGGRKRGGGGGRRT